MKLTSIFSIFAVLATTASALVPHAPQSANVTATDHHNLTIADTSTTNWAHGRCSFHTTLHQFCESKKLRTLMHIPKILDSDHQTIIEPKGKTGKQEMTPGNKDAGWKLWIPGFDSRLIITPHKSGRLEYEYKYEGAKPAKPTCKWTVYTEDGKKMKSQKGCADCRVGDWNRVDLDCRMWQIPRTKDFDCSYACP